jgi:magnesium and cobalt exporter, CNNM family
MVSPYVLSLALGVLLSVGFSAFFSMSETALLTVSRTRLRYLSDQGNPRAKRALELLKRPKRLIATILIGNTVVNIVASVLVTALALEFLSSWALGIATGILTILLLIFGEITPKSFANEHAEWAALHVARPIRFFITLIRPIERSFSYVSKIILRLTWASRVKPVQFHTEEEIKVLLRVGRERGHIDQREAELIRAIFEFNDLELADIMRPGPEVHTVRVEEPLSRVAHLVAQTGHSRFPVVDESGLRPLGLVYAKDLLLMSPEHQRTLSVGAIVRVLPQFTPDMRVGNALQKMQTGGSQMAAVVNAAGHFLGIVTLEDLLEEIVGDITDEYELARRRLERDRARLVDASIAPADGAEAAAAKEPRAEKPA